MHFDCHLTRTAAGQLSQSKIRPPQQLLRREYILHQTCLQLGHKLLGEGAADLLPGDPQLLGVQLDGVELHSMERRVRLVDISLANAQGCAAAAWGKA